MFALRRGVLRKAIFSSSRLSKAFSTRNDSFISGENIPYAEQMYQLWKQDPLKVHSSWNVYFSNLEKGVDSQFAYKEPPFDLVTSASKTTERPIKVESTSPSSSVDSVAQIRLYQMIDHYRRCGHYAADIDPLNEDQNKGVSDDPFFKLSQNPEEYGFTPAELNTKIPFEIKDQLFASSNSWTPAEVAAKLEAIYCGQISFEYKHIPDCKMVKWIQDRIESSKFTKPDKSSKANLLDRIAESQAFSDILERKYPSSKRYGGEGCDAGITGMEHMAEYACELGIKSIIVGMPHRGRFNVMGGMFQKKYSAMFTGFNDPGADKELNAGEWGYSSDVKYHMPAYTVRKTANGNTCDMVDFR